MLQLKSITKDYVAGDTDVHALKGVNLSFRKSEFVSVLGPSGCGKTTLLNIIGGLDHYTAGEMFIDGVSTVNYTDRDWDTYRNHRIGFVFQSYNLIPHQTVSENVELALSISGVDKAERVRRAHEALDKVGLGGQYNKKPNQLSGGQCQRVAIARALVNNPGILLADEPTGALDTTTSVQIMDLIQEIAKECLVIMVTHNPELAEQYSTRIIRLLDGEVVDDTNPYDKEDETAEDGTTVADSETHADDGEKTNGVSVTPESKPNKNTNKKSKLSLWGAFKLSAKNLLSKFKRTFLVCLAGSIGIIGVATVLAVSSGVQNYIHGMQDDMLSGNPVTINAETIDMSALMSAASGSDKSDSLKASVENGYINVDSLIKRLVERSGDMMSFQVKNEITEDYINFVKAMPAEYYNAISLYYGLNLSNNIYTDFAFEKYGGKISLGAANQIYKSMLEETEYKDFSAYIAMFTDSFMQVPDNPDFILSQYEFLTDPALSKVPTEANEIMIVVSSESSLTDLMLAQFGYSTQEEFFNTIYRALGDESYDENLDKDRFSYDELLNKKFVWYPNDTVFEKNEGGSPYVSYVYNAYAQESWQDGKELKITGILKPKKGTSYGCLSRGVYYTPALAAEIIENSMQSDIVKYCIESERDSITSGKFTVTVPDENGGEPNNVTVPYGITYNYSYSLNGTAHENNTGFVGSVSQMSIFGSIMGQDAPETYSLSLRELGGSDIPSVIQIYPTDFNIKDKVTSYLNKWNSDEDLIVNGTVVAASDRSDITITDNLAIVIDMVNELINMVTAALIAFTALSLVVSTVMIAIITYVSVIERIKEIGVIRSLGGRKRDVANLFNAETFIIGGVSGIIGIVITYIISAILNIIIGTLFGIYTIAALPVTSALIMIAISILLTLISGLIPASLASKKDPVVALRTE